MRRLAVLLALLPAVACAEPVWTGPVYVAGARAPMLEAVDLLSAASGVRVERVPDGDPRANVVVVYGGVGCRTYVEWSGRSMVRATVHIGDMRREERCSHHEAMHAWGFLGHSLGDDSVMGGGISMPSRLTTRDLRDVSSRYGVR